MFSLLLSLPLVMVVGVALTTTASTLPGRLDFSERTVAEVCVLLESPDRQIRTAAAISLGFRYHRGGGVLPPSWRAQHPEFPLPPQLITSLAQHWNSDPDVSVRLASLDALATLKHWTNTMSIMLVGLTNEDDTVRVGTCSKLIEVSQQCGEPLAEGVIPTLGELLESEARTEEVWFAVWTAGLLGRSGEPLVPQLRKLTKHESSKVRQYARRALSSIQPKKQKSQ
jgi:HEAT repeat protein